jgi:hypothetical protein
MKRSFDLAASGTGVIVRNVDEAVAVAEILVFAGSAVVVQQIIVRIVVARDGRRLSLPDDLGITVVVPVECAPLVGPVWRNIHVQHRQTGVIAVDDLLRAIGQRLRALCLPLVIRWTRRARIARDGECVFRRAAARATYAHSGRFRPDGAIKSILEPIIGVRRNGVFSRSQRVDAGGDHAPPGFRAESVLQGVVESRRVDRRVIAIVADCDIVPSA